MVVGISLKDGEQRWVVGTERAKRGRGVMNQVGMSITSVSKLLLTCRTGHTLRKSQDGALLPFAAILFKS